MAEVTCRDRKTDRAAADRRSPSRLRRLAAVVLYSSLLEANRADFERCGTVYDALLAIRRAK